MELLSDLNSLQREAVTHADGPLLVVAGVGTGKTTVITRRIAWLIAEKKAQPAEILALTFTEKAAAEMEERVDRLVPYGYVEAQIATFHAFCDRLVRENAIRLGLAPDYRILTEAEQAIFLKEHLFELPLSRLRPLGNPLQHVRSLLTLFSRAKDEDVSPEQYRAYARQLDAASDDAETQHEIAAAYEAYDRLLLQHDCVDFANLIALALRLLREQPHVLARARDRFRYILVDEFQDTNYAQFELLKLLAAHRNVAVCGDDDQSIYKFRGAAISNILGFRDEYPDARIVVLEENYRSTQSILDSAYRLIQNNNPDRLEVKAGIVKRLRSARGAGQPPHQAHFETLDEETDFVAATIDRRRREEGRRFADFAILVRANAHATPFLRAMNLAHVPWRFSGSRGLYDQEEVRAAVAFLRVLADPFDNPSLHYLAGSWFYGLGPEPLAAATALAARKNLALLDLLRNVADGRVSMDLSEADRAMVQRLVGDLTEMISLSTRERTGEVLYRFLTERTGTIERLSASADSSDALRMQYLARLFSTVERFGELARYDRVAWFVDYLDALIEAGDNPPVGDAVLDADAVSVMTIHQAKGLEFPIVFLVGLVSSRFPSADRSDPLPLPGELVKEPPSTGDAHRQEERRLFYVGMTRAKEDVYLTSAKDVGGKRVRKPSLFVSEALDLDADELRSIAGDPLAPVLRHRKAREETRKPLGTGNADASAPLSLSFRQVDDYLTCPRRYRYAHVLHVPTRPHHAMLYGNAVHQAIRFYHLSRCAGDSPSIEDLHEVFRRHWLAEGFLTRQHEELRLQEGLEALRNFHVVEETEGVIPSHVERRFSIVDQGVRVVGIFDRIDLAEDGGRIVDYKTATVHSQAQADERASGSRQLGIYALAFRELFHRLPKALELRFLTPKLIVGHAAPTEKMLDRARGEIQTVASGVRAAEYPAEPVYQACRYCPYAELCADRRSEA